MTEKGTVSWKTLCPTWALVMHFLLSPLLTASLGAGPGRSRQNCSIKGGLKLALSSLGGPSTSGPLTAQGQCLQERLGLWYQVHLGQEGR